MAQVLALIADLMFGSRVQESLGAAGHDVTRVSRPELLRAELRGADVLVVDLMDESFDGPELIASMRAADELGETRTLGFYAHVDVDARSRAVDAGFDLVIPRSRMAREGPAVIDGLVGRGC